MLCQTERRHEVFFGDYFFFDYKSNIEGYSGQDFGGPGQHLYLALSVILLAVLLYLFRKKPQEKVRRVTGFLGAFLIVFYIAKTTWESYYDITLTGAFNTYLLPFDTCSIIMPAAVLAGFGKGRIREMAASWCMTGGILGGFATMLFLNAFKFYPFFSFGAFYSMTWHFLMVFIGLLLVVTERTKLSFSIVKNGFLLHALISLVVIPVDFLFGFDFMLYRELGGVPFFENLAAEFTARRLSFLNPPMMLFLYFLGFSLVFGITALFKNRLFQRTGSTVRRKASLLR
jgi:hypothetical protein